MGQRQCVYEFDWGRDEERREDYGESVKGESSQNPCYQSARTQLGGSVEKPSGIFILVLPCPFCYVAYLSGNKITAQLKETKFAKEGLTLDR